MSNLIPAEREGLYRDLGLEELLDDPERAPDEVLILDDRIDGFGNNIVLAWDPRSQVAHLSISGLDIQTSGERASDANNHPYPLLARKIGEASMAEFIGITETAA